MCDSVVAGITGELIMLKMQLPLKKAEEGDEAAEDETARSGLLSELAFTAASGRLQDTTAEPGAPVLTKESVYEWFGLHLKPAKRIEFMYGLLHMCQPLELRFLGSCLEDLARKDFHVLRDFEIRANSSSDLGLLADVTDPVTRSKLLVCLSLLGSDNRECAGILFRILSHVDPALLVSSCPGSPFHAFRSLSGDSDEDGPHNCGFEPFVESRSGLLEQLAVLFTMASLHPAFLFHQRGKLRLQLEKLEHDLVEQQTRRQCTKHSTQGQPECHFANSQVCVNEKTQSHDLTPAHHSRKAERDGKAHAVHIEKIVLKGISWGKTDREYSFEVKWSDLTTSSITKTHLEMENFLLKLPKEQSTDSFERSILRLLNQKHEGREVEQSLKEKFLSAPHAFRQTGKVCGFFHCGSLSSPTLSCNRWKPFKEDCSEASSQEEDMESYVQEHRKKPGNKSPGLNMRSAEGKRMDHGSENNNLTEWRKKCCTLKPICSQNTKPAGGEGENSSTKPKARSATSDGEKRGRGVKGVPYISNGVMPLPSLLTHHSKAKDTGPCQNAYGETSSESYSSPSSPQHDGRESLESEDEKGKDTDSQSDDSRKSIADSVRVCPVAGGLAESLHSIVSLAHGGQEFHPEGTPRDFPQIHFAHQAPYKIHNGPEVLVTASSPQVPNNKVGAELMMPHPVVMPTPSGAIDNPETCSSEAPSAIQSFNTSVLGLQPPGSPVLQPILHRFKTAGAQSVAECGVLVPPPHQSPMGAISVVQSGTTYPPALQVGYANPDQVLSSITPAESHTKTPGLTLPSALPASFSLPTPTTGIPPIGTMGTASSSQMPAPVVPTHTPGPAPSPIPALTHSIAQSDGNSYINSSASSNIPQLQQQQLPAARPVLGCNACGCRGSCGSGHVPDYYFHAQMAPRQVFNVSPVFQMPSLCSSSYLSQLNQTPQTNGATQVPFYPTAPSAFAGGTLLHPHGHTHSDHVLSSQAASFGLQQMTAFNRFYQPIYATMVPGAGSGPGMALGTVSGGINKKNGSISCYNCGGNGHYAQECKQPLIDATQQGGFRLKYAPHSEVLDNNPD
ncbi:zinc finger CCHC domain-containing protein 2-like isoform X2 [Salminus brasiliensis]|uniref:zinc finger CCHC domain-containing protein 2-like isoform X2 n=1 Tax=Salminus brasiliensis TaxID=930266 RepID=UPI003B83804C